MSLYATGIRVSNSISLDIDDIDRDMGFIRCSKGNRERMIPIGSLAIQALQDYLTKARDLLIHDKDQRALFCEYKRRSVNQAGVLEDNKAV